MATYIFLINQTDEGVKRIKEEASTRRATVENIANELGGEIKAAYMTMGSYDRVLVLDLPEGNAAAQFAIAIGSRGFARTTTLRAYNNEEAAAIIAGAP